jgi:hypothetical protein
MNRVTIVGKNRPIRPDMQDILAQEKSKGHGGLVTVPLRDYGVGVTEAAGGGVTDSEGAG